MRLSSSLRSWALLAVTLLWLWASSVFTPWAEDQAPRLWLYDLLFYLRFALLFWAVAEVLQLALRRKSRVSMQAVPLLATALVVLAAWAYEHSEAGLRWKVAASRDALAAVAHDGYGDRRRRAGHFIVDTTRAPCGDAQPWLWLGRPHGGGTGINLALVRSGNSVPATPGPEAFAFSPVADGWWMAYQHARRYHHTMQHREPAIAAPCVAGTAVTHRQGLAFTRTSSP